MIEMEPNKDPNDLTGDDKKYVHAYDYMGRRVRTRVYIWDTQQEQWETTPDEDRRFMYHERERLLTLDADKDVVFKFIWGPDPSPKRQRGSRLGQLLAIGDDPNSVDYIAFHDGALDTRRGPQAHLAARATPAGGVPRVKGGAGNLGQLADRSDGSLAATYDYTGQSRAYPCDPEDPDSLDDCADCDPCLFDYVIRGDNFFYAICDCGPSHGNRGAAPRLDIVFRPLDGSASARLPGRGSIPLPGTQGTPSWIGAGGQFFCRLGNDPIKQLDHPQ